MNKMYTKYDKQKAIKKVRFIGLGIFIVGLLMMGYLLLPFLSWKMYFESAYASSDFTTPVPKTAVLNATAIKNLLASALGSKTVDYNNAQNWFPAHAAASPAKPIITSYNISIPAIKVRYANVSTIDTDLSKHLVHYPSTALPPEKGTAIIFGHSTLPQLFNPIDYKTIFAYAHTLKKGDEITVNSNGKQYAYSIYSINITTPDDTSIFAQEFDDSYITIVTCTPPGTTWKRLIIKARLQNR